MTATKGDRAVETAADRLDRFVRDARAAGGVKAKVGDALAEDPAFLRKLKPSLIRARAKGEAPPPPGPSGPQLERPKPERKPKRKGSGPSPFLVLGAAFAVGYVVAKVVDWRGHAHPR
jgi:hypothetical protein